MTQANRRKEGNEMKSIQITRDMVQNTADLQRILDQNAGAEVEIVLQEGQYDLDKGLCLRKEHAGMTVRGEGKVRLIGGKRLTGWKVAEDDRIAPEAKGTVLVCDLRENGIGDTKAMVSRGYGRAVVPSHSQLFIDGEPQRLTRYPKEDEFLTIAGVVDADVNEWGEESGKLEAGFYYDDEEPKTWSASEDIWVHGYWSWDWANSYERVAELDTANYKIVNAAPYGNFAFKKGQRFCFLNIIEELTEPGEYYIDRQTNQLYCIPPVQGAEMEAILSLLDEPLLTVKDSADITFCNLQVEAACGSGILVEDCTGVTIDNCHIRNIGTHGVILLRGKNNQVLNSTLHDCGDCGVEAVGGDRLTLESADFRICNNHMYRLSQWSRCYQPPIHMTGVGMTAKNNLIHDCPHTAILYWGNDMTIEDNEIYSVVMETGDAGAIYTGRDYTFRGNRVCHNYVHHLGGVGMGTMGIYNDDCVSGTVMEDNYFVETSRSVMMGGGRNFTVKNNVFVKCNPAIFVDCRGSDDHPVWRKMVTQFLKDRFYHIQNTDAQNKAYPSPVDVSATDPIYMQKYPELAEIDEYYKNGDVVPGSGLIQGNVFCSDFKFHYRYDDKTHTLYRDGEEIPYTPAILSHIFNSRWDVRSNGSEDGTYLYKENVSATPEDFQDAVWGDWNLAEDSKAFRKGYSGRSMAGIGLQKNLRGENPPCVTTAVTVEARENGKAMVLRLWNHEPYRVQGTVWAETKGAGWKLAQPVDFDLESLERKEYILEVTDTEEDFVVRVSSSMPGVRPSIFRVMRIQ